MLENWLKPDRRDRFGKKKTKYKKEKVKQEQSSYKREYETVAYAGNEICSGNEI